MLLIGGLALLLIGVLASGPIKRQAAALFSGAWRPGAGTIGIACVAAGLMLLVRAVWLPGLLLIASGLALTLSARVRSFGGRLFGTGAASGETASSSAMSRADAAAILGVPVTADPATVIAAHRRLIRMAHPDAGGTPGLAAQLNRARDVLTRP